MPRERLVRAATLKKVSLASDLANFEDNRSDGDVRRKTRRTIKMRRMSLRSPVRGSNSS
jgi:hypothetical protein